MTTTVTDRKVRLVQDLFSPDIKVKGEIDHGRYSRIFDIEHNGYHRALKVLSPNFVGNYDDVLEAFAVECVTLMDINHRNVIKAYEGGIRYGLPYMVLDHGGESLEEVATLSVPIPMAVCIYWQIAEGLNALHKKKIVHGDVKPSNVVVNEDGVVRLIDIGYGPDLEELNFSELVSFTPQYAAPEQQEVGGTVKASDVYGLGATMYRLLTNRHPYGRDTPPPSPRESLDERLDIIFDGKRRGVPSVSMHRRDIHPALSYMINASLNPNPDFRPTLEEVQLGLLETGAFTRMEV
jgi:serine/threonine protein kinase